MLGMKGDSRCRLGLQGHTVVGTARGYSIYAVWAVRAFHVCWDHRGTATSCCNYKGALNPKPQTPRLFRPPWAGLKPETLNLDVRGSGSLNPMLRILRRRGLEHPGPGLWVEPLSPEQTLSSRFPPAGFLPWKRMAVVQWCHRVLLLLLQLLQP